MHRSLTIFCAHACACVFIRTRIRAIKCELFPIGVDRVRFGSQAFTSASAFNVDIGAWNTARVTTELVIGQAPDKRKLLQFTSDTYRQGRIYSLV